MDASTRFDTQIVGGLPVVLNYLERLKVADTINRLVPSEGEVPIGTLVEIFIINRLLAPKPLYRLDQWAQETGVADYYGLDPRQLNDDRLGRTLERLQEHRVNAQTGLTLNAIRTFDLDVSQIHYDITSVEFFGAYDIEVADGQTPPTPMPKYGHTKSGRKNVKQIQMGLNVTGDGGVPVAQVPLDGNTAESTTHIQNLRALREMLPKGKLVYIADTKLDTPENLLEVEAGGGRFLCGGAFTIDLQEQFLRKRKKLQPVAYYPKSQENVPPQERDHYKAFETTARLEGKVNERQIHLEYRLIFVWSESKSRQEAKTRERHVAKIQAEFEAVVKNLNRYSLKTRDAVIKRLEVAKARYRVGKLFDYEVIEDRKGHLSMTWRLNPKALQEWRQLEGVYVLKTSLPKRGHPLAKVMAKYKEQSKVERRIHHLKGPLAVAPMFLKNPERMAGLLCVMVWALMVLALMERQVRRSLKGKPMYGLYPENRPSPAPTGPAILQGFASLCIVIVKHRGAITRRLAQADATQQKLLALLKIPPESLRAFKRRCNL
jgi:transposase